jgi:hypothetical protein
MLLVYSLIWVLFLALSSSAILFAYVQALLVIAFNFYNASLHEEKDVA